MPSRSRFQVTAALACVIAVASALVGSDSAESAPAERAGAATAPGKNGRIAFKRYFEGGRSTAAIYTIGADGRGERKVTSPARGVVDDQPDWSPDGSLLVFHRTGTPYVPSPGLVAPTTSGAVGGILDGSVKEWRGIPYAAPPVGALRWRPPASVRPWSGIRDATAFAPPCIQLDFANGGTLGSEDCLYLNVFVPGTATADSRLAVMVHLHPGSNSYLHPYTDAGAFTDRNVIVVTLAYRLGVFGFVGHPALTAEGGGSSGEYGVLDQLAALRWVQENIGAFGGDPARVTLFGSSAGSFDTVALMASPLSQGLIARAAVQGEYRNYLTEQFNTITDGEQIGLEGSQALGCESSENVLACLRAIPAPVLVELLCCFDLGPRVGGAVLPEAPLRLINERMTVPLLVGFDREEDAVFFFQENSLDSPYPTSKWVQDTNALVGPDLGARARSLYQPSSYDSLRWSYITMLTDAMHGCSTRRLANAVRAPVWRYLYTHTYEDDAYFAQFRASHVLEEPLLWHADVLDYGHVLTPAEEALSGRMTDYWTNFAKTGNPNSAGLPSWPQYNTVSEPTLTLDDEIGVITNYHAEQCALLDAIPVPFPAPWEVGQGQGPPVGPPGFLYGRARAIP